MGAEGKAVLISETGYKVNYFCKSCYKLTGEKKFFRSLSALHKHYEKYHQGEEVEYGKVVVDGRYIQERMHKCKTKTVVLGHVHGECEYEKKIPVACHVRICSKCEDQRRISVFRKYYEGILQMKHPKMLTVTYYGHHPLSARVKWELEGYMRSFIKRIIRKIMKMPGKYEVRYLRVIEFVPKDDGYYYHYHLIIDMPYISQKWLSEAWLGVTGESKVIDIRSLERTDKRGKRRVLNYVLKYVTKPMKIDETKQDVYDLYAREIYGKHLVESRGLLHLINGGNSSMNMCPVCGEKLVFLGLEENEEVMYDQTKPPPPQKVYVMAATNNLCSFLYK